MHRQSYFTLLVLCGLSRRPAFSARPQPRHGGELHGVGRLPNLPPRRLRALEQDTHGQRGSRSEGASRSHPSRSIKTRSTGEVHEGRYRIRLRQQMETALFHEKRRRLFSAGRAMGRDAPDLARLPGRPRLRLVDRVLSQRQYAAPYRPPLRWLPFGQLQHPDQSRHRVERGM